MTIDANRARFNSLDGLRGLAALVVVVYHIALTDPKVASVYLSGEADPLNALEWAMYSTPLHALWSGREAVLIFFVLSGFVLALPSAKGRVETWSSYFPRRILRIYLPAVGSLVFAYATTIVVARTVVPGGSVWLNEHAVSPHGFMQVVFGSTLMGGFGGLNTPLWSLRWEVIFSLLLPVYLILARAVRVRFSLSVVTALALILAGAWTGALDGGLMYLPVFAVGVFMAYNTGVLSSLARSMKPFQWIVLYTFAIFGVTSSAVLSNFIDPPHLLRAVSTPLISLGAAMVVFIAAWHRPAERTLSGGPVRWLGRVSFSLYLTHEPVLIAVVYALGGTPPLWVTYAIAVPASLAVSELFYRIVEGPSHRISQIVGSRLKNRADAKRVS